MKPTIPTTVRLTDGLIERIKKAAAKAGLSRNEFVQRSLEKAAAEALGEK
jgi:predicted DNA binding CopG/RHH family protein